MTKRTVPPVEEIICDCCGRTCGKGAKEAERKQNGHLELKCFVLDYLDDPTAAHTMRDDFCDSCLRRVIEVLNETKKLRRLGLKIRDDISDNPSSLKENSE